MINYIKGENYRLLRKKSLYLTSVACFLLIAAAAVTLYLFGEYEASFPYATSSFFYANVISGGLLIVIVALLFNASLTGKDLSLLKQSVSFGISRNTIFWSKLILTLSYFLLVCVIGLALMIGLGENLFIDEGQFTRSFIIASINMLPIVLCGFFMIHALKMLKIGEVYIIIWLLFVFIASGDVLRMMLKPISPFDQLYKYAPSTLLDENLMQYMDQTVQLDVRFWLVGMVVSVIFLTIGVRKFAKQTIN